MRRQTAARAEKDRQDFDALVLVSVCAWRVPGLALAVIQGLDRPVEWLCDYLSPTERDFSRTAKQSK